MEILKIFTYRIASHGYICEKIPTFITILRISHNNYSQSIKKICWSDVRNNAVGHITLIWNQDPSHEKDSPDSKFAIFSGGIWVWLVERYPDADPLSIFWALKCRCQIYPW